MNGDAQQIRAMLARKTEVERNSRSNSVASTRWLADAVELLLRIELERQEGKAHVVGSLDIT